MPVNRKRWRWPIVVGTAVVLAGGGTAYAVAAGEDAPNYRTVTVAKGDVEQTLTLAGLVDAARRSDLAFGTDGTVASVKVAAGDRVTAGQVIATLETASLDAAVTEAEASVAAAIAQLASDSAAQTSDVQAAVDQTGNGQTGNGQTGSGQPSGTQGGNGSANGASGGSSDAQSTAILKKLQSQQKAVLAAQTTASAALKAAAEALTVQTAACADAYTASAAADADADAGTDAGTDASRTAGTDQEDQNAACDTALADVQAKQAAVKTAQDTLAKALENLTKTLSSALGSVTGQASGQPAGQDQPSAARTSAETPTDSSSAGADTPSSSGGTVTAARLASDQAQIDQARADLITAKTERRQATLRSTRTGKVVSLDLSRGDAVSSGSTVAVVVGGNAVTLTGTVAEASIGQVKVGQVARVSVPGSSTTTQGTVTSIGMTADSSSGSTSYPVTVIVEDPSIALPTGSRAQVSIVLATAKDVLTVPISALTRQGEAATVKVWDGKKLARTPVTLGAVGSRTAAVTSGLEAGADLVLADVDQAISGASSELNQRGGFGPGGDQPVMKFRSPNGGTATVGGAPK